MKELRITILQDEKPVAGFSLTEKKFKTGSRGYHAQGKVELDAKRYQGNFLLVEIGSKPAKK